MPASYVHQCVATNAADALSLFEEPALRSALLAGSEGPDPLFFSLAPTPGSPYPPRVGSILHTRHTDDFLLTLAELCRSNDLLRAYCCGFFTHYATDTTFHPFVYAHSLDASGHYSGHAHCRLEHQLETLHFRREGHRTGLPVQMVGFVALDASQKAQIAQALSQAIRTVFPENALRATRVQGSFDDAIRLCRMLRSETGKKYHTLGALLSPLRLDAALHAHMMPLEPPQADIANDAHASWASIWTPGQTRNDSFSDLFSAAVQRAQALMQSANGFMLGRVSYASLRSLHGGYSYDSGLPWQTTCAASQAPGVSP